MEGLVESEGKPPVSAYQKISASCLGGRLVSWVPSWGETWRMLDGGALGWSSPAVGAGSLHACLPVLTLTWVSQSGLYLCII